MELFYNTWSISILVPWIQCYMEINDVYCTYIVWLGLLRSLIGYALATH